MTHLIHSFTWRSRFSSVPGLFPCQTLWEAFSSLSKELNFSVLFSLLTFPDQAHTFLLDLLIILLLPHSVYIPISLLLHSGLHLPDSLFWQVYLDSFYSLPMLSPPPPPPFGWYFSDWTNYPFLSFQKQAGVSHVLYKTVCMCLSLHEYRCRHKPKLAFPSRSKSTTINFPLSHPLNIHFKNSNLGSECINLLQFLLI